MVHWWPPALLRPALLLTEIIRRNSKATRQKTCCGTWQLFQLLRALFHDEDCSRCVFKYLPFSRTWSTLVPELTEMMLNIFSNKSSLRQNLWWMIVADITGDGWAGYWLLGSLWWWIRWRLRNTEKHTNNFAHWFMTRRKNGINKWGPATQIYLHIS